MRSHDVLSLLLGLLSGSCAAPAQEATRPGVDVLLTDSLHLVRDRRVGLLTNQTGVDRTGQDDLTRLRDAGVAVAALFSPEHGFRGALDMENIGHGVDSATGLPVFSLYGAVREPTPDMLARIDVLLVDLQDIGSRTYTYVSTALLALGAAARAGVPVVVLDRPNPIGGLMQGPVLDPAYATPSAGLLPVPLRHGMTIGELVRLGNDTLQLGGRLTVVPVAGWTRDRWFDATGLPWVRPSPNMPDLESATHYPGIVLFEATNLSVGRGTPIAFQVIGAPWLDATSLAAAVADEPGVAVTDTVIAPRSPTDGKYDGQTLAAVRFRVTDRTRYHPVRLAVRLAAEIRTRQGDSLRVNARRFDQLAGTDALRRDVMAGQPVAAILASWAGQLAAFQAVRARYGLYDSP